MNKGLWKTVTVKEHELNPEEHSINANGYCTRDLLNLMALEGCTFPMCGKGISIANSSSYQRGTLLELPEAILALLYAGVVSMRGIFRFP